ncbi:MAG: type III secretion system cytoplasmic ring protein SctQ, partial [Myxococcaceae bacterium]
MSNNESRTVLDAGAVPRVVGGAARAPNWRPYRFSNLEKISRAQMLLLTRLEWLLPSAASTARVSEQVQKRLRELFETDVRMVVDYVHVLKPNQLRKIVADPTFLAVLAPAPHKTRGFLEIELSLAHAMIDELLGGGGETVALRPLTDIEEGVMSFVLLETLKALAPNIEPGLPRIRVEGIAKTVEEAAGALSEEQHVVVVQLKSVLGSHAGFVRIFLPESLLGMTSPPRDGPARKARRAVETAANIGRLAGLSTWLRAEIGRAEITGRDLGGLHAGDVVLLDEVTARTDRGEAGTARLKVGLGKAA